MGIVDSENIQRPCGESTRKDVHTHIAQSHPRASSKENTYWHNYKVPRRLRSFVEETLRTASQEHKDDAESLKSTTSYWQKMTRALFEKNYRQRSMPSHHSLHRCTDSYLKPPDTQFCLFFIHYQIVLMNLKTDHLHTTTNQKN